MDKTPTGSTQRVRDEDGEQALLAAWAGALLTCHVADDNPDPTSWAIHRFLPSCTGRFGPRTERLVPRLTWETFVAFGFGVAHRVERQATSTGQHFRPNQSAAILDRFECHSRLRSIGGMGFRGGGYFGDDGSRPP
jgi:hypothetical protein